MNEDASRRIEQLIKEHSATWLALPGVEAVGQGRVDDQACIRIYLSEPTTTGLPSEIDGIPICEGVSGMIRAQE